MVKSTSVKEKEAWKYDGITEDELLVYLFGSDKQLKKQLADEGNAEYILQSGKVVSYNQFAKDTIAKVLEKMANEESNLEKKVVKHRVIPGEFTKAYMELSRKSGDEFANKIEDKLVGNILSVFGDRYLPGVELDDLKSDVDGPYMALREMVENTHGCKLAQRMDLIAAKKLTKIHDRTIFEEKVEKRRGSFGYNFRRIRRKDDELIRVGFDNETKVPFLQTESYDVKKIPRSVDFYPLDDNYLNGIIDGIRSGTLPVDTLNDYIVDLKKFYDAQ